MAAPRDPISVVIPTRDRPGMLAGCLAVLRDEASVHDEVVVVDSASSDNASVAAVVAAHGARLVRVEQAGSSLARNIGWRAARHDLIGFVDDDVRVRPGWMDAMRQAMSRPDAPAFVTGRIVVPDDQAAAERPVAVSSRTEGVMLTPALSGDLGASANLLLRRSALLAVGGFDERLGPGTWSSSAEDLDLFDRLFAAGCSGWFEPAALAEHVQWRTRRQLLRLDWAYGKGMGVRLARLSRRDRPRARRLIHEALVEQGWRHIRRDLANGYEFGAATVSARTIATVVGLVAGGVAMRGAGS